MSDVPSTPLPSVRRAQAIDELRRVFLTRFADSYSTASILTNVLFENAKHAMRPEDGLTRAELRDLANAYLDRVTDGNRTIAEEELTRDIPRIVKRVREFSAYLPLYRYGVQSISGPTHEARGDAIRRLWLRIECTEASRGFSATSPETTGMRDLDHMHADLVVELVAAFTAHYIDTHWLEFGVRSRATRLLFELLHICARETRHRRGVAAITASTIELNALWTSIAESSGTPGGPADRIGPELTSLARALVGKTPWVRRLPVPSDSHLFYDAELQWNYVETHGGRFEMHWRFWHVFNDARGAELTTAEDILTARPISLIPLLQAASAVGTGEPNDDPVLTSLAQAMVARLGERKDTRLILFLHALEDLAIKIVALVRSKRKARESERTADVLVVRQRDNVVVGVASTDLTVTDGALARTVLSGSIAPSRERHPPVLQLVDDDDAVGSDDERERTVAYFKMVDEVPIGRLTVLLDHMLPAAALNAQTEEIDRIRALVRAAAVTACNELAKLGALTSPMAFFFARYMEIIDEWRAEDADADAGGPHPAIEVLRRARLERLGLQDMLYRRATTFASTISRLPGAAALAAAGRIVVRFMRETDPIEFHLARQLEGDLRIVARILERYRTAITSPL